MVEKIAVPEGMLRVSWYMPDTDCLGPGERFALWVQGCRQRCKDCVAQRLQDIQGGELVSVKSLADMVIGSSADGLTISGGEPFLQAGGLAELIGHVKRKRVDMGVMIFTGYLYEELLQDEECKKLIELTDVLIDGRYMQELDDGLPMRGSSNQRIIYLTDKYSPDMMPTHRKNKALITENGYRMIGIPSSGARELMEILSSEEKI